MNKKRIENNLKETEKKLEIFKKNNWKDTGQEKFQRIIFNSQNLYKNNLKILDIGCRGGFLFDEIKKYNNKLKLYGIDISPEAIEVLHKKDYKGEVCDIQEHHLNQKFDLIYLIHVLEHCEDPDRVISNIYKMLNKNGYLYVEVPKREVGKDKDESHFYQFPTFKILDLMFNKNEWECIYAQDDFPIIGIYKKK